MTRFCAGGLLLVALFAMLGSAAWAKPVVIDRIVATVDGAPITLFELDRHLRLAAGANPGKVTKEDREKALEALIADTLVRIESRRLGLSVSKKELDLYIEEIKRGNGLDDETLAQALAQQGYTPTTYRKQVSKELLKNQLVARQIRQNVQVSSGDVRAFYEKHKSDFAKAGAVHLRQIFFVLPPNAPEDLQTRVATVAQGALAELSNGTSFQDVAKKYSQGPEAADGGALGWMEKGQMIPELEQVAFSLRPGQVAPPIRTAAGVHILSVDKMKASEYVPLSDVEAQITERLIAEEVSEKFQSYVETDLMEGHAIVRRLHKTGRDAASSEGSSGTNADAEQASDSGDHAG